MREGRAGDTYLRISRVIRRSSRGASSGLSGFANGYCGSLIYDEVGMKGIPAATRKDLLQRVT